MQQRAAGGDIRKTPDHVEPGRGFADPGRRGEWRLKPVAREALREMRKAVGQERTGEEPGEIKIPGHRLFFHVQLRGTAHQLSASPKPCVSTRRRRSNQARNGPTKLCRGQFNGGRIAITNMWNG